MEIIKTKDKNGYFAKLIMRGGMMMMALPQSFNFNSFVNGLIS